jgi:hypothetical protein
MWQSCLDNEIVTTRDGGQVINGGVYVKKIRANTKEENDVYGLEPNTVSYGKAVAELAKYTVKMDNYILKKPTDEELQLYEDMQDLSNWKTDSRGNYFCWPSERKIYEHVELCKELEKGKTKKEIKTLYDDLTEDAIKTMDLALKGRRLIGFGGIMKEIHKELNLKDIDDGDLVNCDIEENIAPDVDYEIWRYSWKHGHKNYLRLECDIINKTNLT